MSRAAAQRASQLLASAAHSLQQWRGAKAVTTKLSVEMLKVSAAHRRGGAAQLAAARRCRRRRCLLPLTASPLCSMPFVGPLSHDALQDVEGVGTQGSVARVNHGYARNHLVPNRLARVVPRARRGHLPAAAAAAADADAAAAAAAAARAAAPGAQSLERQQQQFDKLMKTLTGSTLVGGFSCRHGPWHAFAVHASCCNAWLLPPSDACKPAALLPARRPSSGAPWTGRRWRRRWWRRTWRVRPSGGCPFCCCRLQ